uniref:SAM domain-containing protein n=1 Tax=Haemonchus contortus TaxID=6289 RepID=A0A7I4Z5E9_HAECO
MRENRLLHKRRHQMAGDLEHQTTNECSAQEGSWTRINARLEPNGGHEMVKAMTHNGAYDYVPSSSLAPYSGIVARAHDRRDVAAMSARIQKMERALDLTKYIQQVEKLLAQPIKIPGSTLVHHQTRGLPGNRRPSIFSAKGIYPTEEIRKHKLSKLFNFQHVKEREWLQEILLEESDSDDDGEMVFTVRDIRAAVKVHQMRRKLQKRYHSDRSNSQFTYYSAGLLSNDDPFPEHQSTILRNLTANRLE